VLYFQAPEKTEEERNDVTCEWTMILSESRNNFQVQVLETLAREHCTELGVSLVPIYRHTLSSRQHCDLITTTNRELTL
jgi:hypothetical protein